MTNSTFAFWNFLEFFFSSNIFDPRLIRVTNGEPKDTEVRLQLNTNRISVAFNDILVIKSRQPAVIPSTWKSVEF